MEKPSDFIDDISNICKDMEPIIRDIISKEYPAYKNYIEDLKNSAYLAITQNYNEYVESKLNYIIFLNLKSEKIYLISLIQFIQFIKEAYK